MITAVGSGARPSRLRLGPVAVAAVSVLAAAGFALLRLGWPAPYAYSSTGGACHRLREAGLTITSADWFCQPQPWTARASYVSASLLLAIGFVLPCLILAATGRRVIAVAPLLVAPTLILRGVVVADHWWSGTWRDGTVEGGAAMALLLLAPVLAAIAAARRTARPVRRPVSLLACAATWMLIAIPIAGLVQLWLGMSVRHFEALGGTFDGFSMVVPAAISMALFASLLGPDRRWWPWSLVPVAVLLSGGPSMALLVAPAGFTDWSRFGAVVPLFAVGMVASGWRPLADRVTTWIRRDAVAADSPPPARPVPLVDPNRVRPTVILNAVGAGLLLVSMVAFRGDPLPAQLGTALPTYLGARVSVMDLRTRQLLHQALADMDAYRSREGSYRGFDAMEAARSDPVLTWRSGLPLAPEGGKIQELTMGIVTASETTARVVSVSGSGNAICIQRDAGGIAYGVGSGRNHTTSTRALEGALAACGSTQWTPDALRPFPVATLCQGLEEDVGYSICRMMQAMLTETLERTGPA